MKVTVIITSFKEPKTIGKAISQVLNHNKGLKKYLDLIVVSPDEATIKAAKKELSRYKEYSTQILKDPANGKPAALNLAVSKANSEILIFTDGDMYVDKNAIAKILAYFKDPKVAGVSGHPISLDSKNTMFGYYSHLFCEAAHQKRLSAGFVSMSGYLYAIRNTKGLFPIPNKMRAEDAYITKQIADLGYKIGYSPESYAYVHFPRNIGDWISQKLRSLGGNVQISEYDVPIPNKNSKTELTSKETKAPQHRSMLQDLKMSVFPFAYARNAKEYLYSILLYPLRLYLWILIYIQHLTNSYSKGSWKRIESSKG